MDKNIAEIFLSDSDDETYIPLSKRLQKTNVITDEIVTLGDSDDEPPFSRLDSSLSSIGSLVLSEKNSSENNNVTVTQIPSSSSSSSLRRANTISEFSPVVSKIKKANTPSRSKCSSNSDLVSLPSTSFHIDYDIPTANDCLDYDIPSANDYLDLDLDTPRTNDTVDLPSIPIPSSSQATINIASQSSTKSTSQASVIGRAPIRPISSRDCEAVIPTELFGKFFKKEELLKAFAESEVRFIEVKTSAFKNTITWLRETKDEFGDLKKEPENQVLVLVTLEETVNMVCKYIETINKNNKITKFISLDDDDSDLELIVMEENAKMDLVDFSTKIASIYPNTSITLMLTGMSSYFKRLKNKEQQEFRDAIRGTQSRKRKSIGLPIIKEKDLLDALVDLDMKSSQIVSVGFNVRTVRVDKVDEIVTLIASYSKSIAECPHKKQQKQLRTMAWYADNDSKYAVDIKDVPQDIERLWKKQLEQFPKVSREVAESIAKVYPNPYSLMQAYLMTPNEERILMLEDIKIGKGTRRLGREISKKICNFFNSDNPDEFL